MSSQLVLCNLRLLEIVALGPFREELLISSCEVLGPNPVSRLFAGIDHDEYDMDQYKEANDNLERPAALTP